LFKAYLSCELCPRRCKRNRFFEKGYCGQTAHLRVAYVGPHFGEEPPISGRNGSGTVFLVGCSLKCSFCQNWQISHKGIGRRFKIKELVEEIDKMIREQNVHNINFVTPDHFIPHIVQVIKRIKMDWPEIPIVFNVSGYQSINILKEIEEYVDIYLPDFKYSDRRIAAKLSSCPDYPSVALDAISEMLKQKGFLDINAPLAKKGVIVRHLILPGYIHNSIDALSMLYIEFGKELPISLMSQYKPVLPQKEPSLNRKLKKEEFLEIYQHMLELGFENVFVQFPEDTENESAFVPDFTSSQPFKGNLKKGFDTR
jgi:putative pyruvate formate lyase activating enzyme